MLESHCVAGKLIGNMLAECNYTQALSGIGQVPKTLRSGVTLWAVVSHICFLLLKM